MNPSDVSRRTLLKGGAATLASLSVLRLSGPAHAFQTPVAGEVIPWLDQPAERRPRLEEVVLAHDLGEGGGAILPIESHA